jgi:hypothetical protein
LKYNPDKVTTGIISCKYFVPIITSDSISSQWVNQEIGYAFGTNKNVYPLVENKLINSLKGLVNDDRDLPYTFIRYGDNPSKSQNSFRAACKNLISDIVKNNTILLDSFFQGVWGGSFVFDRMKFLIKEITVKNNIWYEKGNPEYYISNVEYEKEKRKLRFMRTSITDSSRNLHTILTLSPNSLKYNGVETGGSYGQLVIEFYRTDTK